MLPVGNGRESLQRESGREALITQPHSGAGVRFDLPTFSRKYCSARETLVQRNMVFISTNEALTSLEALFSYQQGPKL